MTREEIEESIRDLEKARETYRNSKTDLFAVCERVVKGLDGKWESIWDVHNAIHHAEHRLMSALYNSVDKEPVGGS